jgi:hypothetical protein
MNLAIYTGTCGALTQIACVDATGGAATESITLNMSANVTYYIELQQGDGNTSASAAGTFCITDNTPPSNDNPCGAQPISVFSTCVPTTVENYNATQNAVPGQPISCGAFPQSNWLDVWYSVTVPPDGNLTFSFSQGTLTDAVAAIYSSSNGTCSGTLTQIACDDDSGPITMPALSVSGQTPGSTLWVRLWDYQGNNEGDFTVCATGNVGSCTPTTSDCAGAIPLCSDAPVSNLASGQGCSADLNSGNDGCLAGEHNSTWFLIQIGSTGGTWGFDGVFGVASNGIEYDWALWQVSGNPATNPALCGSLSSPIRCSYASQAGKSEVAMGMNSTDPDLSESASPSGNGYTQWLTNALPGEYYLLMVDRWSTAGGAFTLDFTGSASMNCAITTLPIELLSFTGQRNGADNIINWTTATELNNDFFTIEKSKDLLEWEVLGVQDGAGNSQQVLHYNMIDREPFGSVTYYRLRQADYDGKDKLSYTISVLSTVDADGLFTEVFPNPTNGSFYFNYAGSNLKSPIEVDIYNNSGKLIQSHTFEDFSKYQSVSVDTENLSNGVYKVVLKQGDYFELRRISVIR